MAPLGVFTNIRQRCESDFSRFTIFSVWEHVLRQDPFVLSDCNSPFYSVPQFPDIATPRVIDGNFFCKARVALEMAFLSYACLVEENLHETQQVFRSIL